MSYLNSQYEIYENLYGQYRIMDLIEEELVTVGGTPLICDSEEEAVNFLDSLMKED